MTDIDLTPLLGHSVTVHASTSRMVLKLSGVLKPGPLANEQNIYGVMVENIDGDFFYFYPNQVTSVWDLSRQIWVNSDL